MVFKPLLSGKADLDKVTFPVLASPKLDGIRCIWKGGKCVSRNGKPIPNPYVEDIINQEMSLFSERELMLDGELWFPGEPFKAATSGIMTKNPEKARKDFVFAVFDCVEDYDFEMPFGSRILTAQEVTDHCSQIAAVDHFQVNDIDHLMAVHKNFLVSGYEGTMIRSFDGKYKQGRSTVNEGILLKIKEFADEEATIIGLEEQMHNANEAKTNDVGHTERSTCKENLEPMNVLGALRLRFDDGTEFQCGSGFTATERREYWDLGAELHGRRVTIKHQPDPGGRKEGQAPRFPVFVGFREDI